MKNIHFVFIALVSFFLFYSCKKDAKNTSSSGSSKSMGILYDYATAPGGAIIKNRFILLNIDHAGNNDKQFMTIDIVENADGYKFKIAEGPKPITDFATNFPADVRKIISGKGLGNDFFVNAYMKMRASGITRPYTFTYDSIHKFIPSSSIIIPLNEMHNPVYAGTMAGKNPQAGLELWAPGKPGPGTGPVIPNDSMPEYFFYAAYPRVSKPCKLYFYFDEGYYTSVVSPLGKAIPLDKLIYNGGPQINGITGKIDAALSYEGNSSVIFFFDYDQWEYFTVTFPCSPVYGAACGNNIDISPLKSMNALMTWPAGWGKN